ncbi:histidine phosphatase family protein [Streptomyces sp. WAC 06738]|uniref:histidine phosphatase family protein n=1 Tax=Streptomyces sp. WAC 06738 TaxID=2203210 RepID=UPI000F6F965C|nr:histidine phosphatase family protein [Streptomyces sp. WAC 06738]AZM49385.1 histidine phosphatase family protein [Streptomyces sp. WAC 06738]
MSLNVIFVRHGESVWHGENRYAGATDIDLTDHGRDQAAALADWAAQAGLTAVWSSPMLRCRQTAAGSAAAAGLPLHLDPRLRELDFGVAEGLTRAEMRERMPEAVASFEADPVAGHFPEGEDPAAVVERYAAFLADLRAEHDTGAQGDGKQAGGKESDGRILVVAHSTAIRLTLCRLLGLPLRDYRRRFPYLANCALNELVLSDGTPSLLTLNRPVTPGVPA